MKRSWRMRWPGSETETETDAAAAAAADADLINRNNCDCCGWCMCEVCQPVLGFAPVGSR